jgi:hypothetical protein
LIIALGHKKRVGKDTFAKFLSQTVRCERPKLRVKTIGFADKLKDICHQLFAWAGLQAGIYYENYPELKEVILPAIGMSPREVHIKVGNGLRAIYGPIWIENAIHTQADIVLIKDLRFPNEVAAVKRKGGLVFKITRPGVPLGDDEAEVALDDFNGWDCVFENHGTLQDFGRLVEAYAADLLRG